MKFIDIADEPEIQAIEGGSPDRNVNFCTEDRCFRIAQARFRDPTTGEFIPEEERTWVLWDVREMSQPWGPLSTPRGKPVALLVGIPNLELARVCAILAVRSKLFRGALTARLVVKGLLHKGLSALAKRKAELGR